MNNKFNVGDTVKVISKTKFYPLDYTFEEFKELIGHVMCTTEEVPVRSGGSYYCTAHHRGCTWWEFAESDLVMVESLVERRHREQAISDDLELWKASLVRGAGI